MLFSQTTEMLNHHMSNGLPANLAADDPSQSFCLKGLDINMAAYQSELAFLANPVSNHVQSAEMHNQAINSLALLSARYTYQAVELVALLSASALYAACQAVDLRVMHATFLEKVTLQVAEACAHALPAYVNDANYETIIASGAKAMHKTWWDHGSMDFVQRSEKAAWVFVLHVAGLDLASRSNAHLDFQISQLNKLQSKIKSKLLTSFTVHRTEFLESPNTSQYLGAGTARLYAFVRDNLQVPMHHGLEDHPSCATSKQTPHEKKTIGSRVSVIYEAIRDGRLFGHLADGIEKLGLLGLPN